MSSTEAPRSLPLPRQDARARSNRTALSSPPPRGVAVEPDVSPRDVAVFDPFLGEKFEHGAHSGEDGVIAITCGKIRNNLLPLVLGHGRVVPHHQRRFRDRVAEKIKKVVGIVERNSGLAEGVSSKEITAELDKWHREPDMGTEAPPIWSYEAQDGSPKRDVFRRPPAADGESVGAPEDLKLVNKPRGRTVASKGTQEAHILFKDGFKAAMKFLLTTALPVDDKGAESLLAPPCKLTLDLYYKDHQEYDNFHYIFAWKFSDQGNGLWKIQLVPCTLTVAGDEILDLPNPVVPNVTKDDLRTWGQALVLRKYHAILHTDMSVVSSHMKEEWDAMSNDGTQSKCWKD